MKSCKIFFAIVLLFLVGCFAGAQETVVLTLEKSIEIALSQNPYHLASEERVAAASSQVRAAAANFFPTIEAQGLHTLDEKLFELEFPSFIPGEPPERVAIDFTKDYQFSLSVSLPLFTGGRLISGFKQAKYNLNSAKESVRLSQQVTVFNAKRAFYGYLLAEEFVRVAEEAVEVAEKQLKNVQNMYEVGMVSKYDLLSTEVRLANLKPELIKARNNRKIAELGLKNLLGMDLSQDVEIKGSMPSEFIEPNMEKCIEKALLNRPELYQLKYQKQVGGEMLKMARAAYLPTVALGATYNFWADKFDFHKDTWANYYAINLVVSLPLFSGFSKSAQVAQSKAMLREVELTQRGLEDMVKLEVRQAVLKVMDAKESFLSQEKNVDQAKESLRIAELNYSEGLATTLDVSSAQAALTRARMNNSQALFDYVVFLAELDKAMGLD